MEVALPTRGVSFDSGEVEIFLFLWKLVNRLARAENIVRFGGSNSARWSKLTGKNKETLEKPN